jgi:hypothetical protein
MVIKKEGRKVELPQDLADVLGEWLPKGIEASAVVDKALDADPILAKAVEDAAVMMIGELVNEMVEKKKVNGLSFQGTVSKPVGKKYAYVIVLAITNADEKKPSTRLLAMTPEDVKANDVVWGILGESSQKILESMIQFAPKLSETLKKPEDSN